MEYPEDQRTLFSVRRRLFEQAKQCQTTNGAALLISVSNWIAGVDTFENQKELWQEFDRVVNTIPE